MGRLYLHLDFLDESVQRIHHGRQLESDRHMQTVEDEQELCISHSVTVSYMSRVQESFEASEGSFGIEGALSVDPQGDGVRMVDEELKGAAEGQKLGTGINSGVGCGTKD